MAFPDSLAILDLETLLRCPVCFELPPPPILLCTRGHHVCLRCRQLLTNCPTCTASLTKTRSFLAEDLIQKIEFIPNKKPAEEESTNNCCKKRKLSKNTDSLAFGLLPEGLFHCPLEGCKNGGHSMGVGLMISHIKNVHEHLYFHFKNTGATFTTNFTLDYKRQKNHHKAIHISNMGLFYLTVKIYGDHNINSYLKFTAPEYVSNRFEYEIVISSLKQSFSHVDQVPPLEKDISWLLQRGRILIIPAKDHSLFGKFDVRVTVVFNSTKRCNGNKKQKSSTSENCNGTKTTIGN